MQVSIADRQARTVLTRLREETREAHEELELGLDLISPRLTRETYGLVLQRFYRFYSAFERAVWPRLPPGWATLFSGRKKAVLLEEDLAALSLTPGQLDGCPVPDYTDLRQIWGALYVTEGATLGGQIISRHVRDQLGLAGVTGLRFFASYGSEVGSNWKKFTQLLIEEVSPDDADKVVEGAKSTFAAMSECLVESVR